MVNTENFTSLDETTAIKFCLQVTLIPKMLLFLIRFKVELKNISDYLDWFLYPVITLQWE